MMEDKKELKPEEMNQVNGGYIVHPGKGKGYYIYDDDNNMLLGKRKTKKKAKSFAKKKHVSTEMHNL